jgi:hypothetical protein
MDAWRVLRWWITLRIEKATLDDLPLNEAEVQVVVPYLVAITSPNGVEAFKEKDKDSIGRHDTLAVRELFKSREEHGGIWFPVTDLDFKSLEGDLQMSDAVLITALCSEEDATSLSGKGFRFWSRNLPLDVSLDGYYRYDGVTLEPLSRQKVDKEVVVMLPYSSYEPRMIDTCLLAALKERGSNGAPTIPLDHYKVDPQILDTMVGAKWGKKISWY